MGREIWQKMAQFPWREIRKQYTIFSTGLLLTALFSPHTARPQPAWMYILFCFGGGLIFMILAANIERQVLRTLIGILNAIPKRSNNNSDI